MQENSQKSVRSFLTSSEVGAGAEECKEMLAQIEAGKVRLEAVLCQMPAGVMIAEAPPATSILVNEQAQKIFGCSFAGIDSIEQLTQLRDCKLFHQDGKEYQPQEWPLARALRTGELVENEEIEVVREDGTRVFVHANASPIKDQDDRISAAVMAFQDITQYKQAEKALLQSETRFRQFVQSVKDYAIFMLDPQGTILNWNEGAAQLKGYSAEEVIGQHVSIFYTPEDIRAGKPEKEMKTALAEGQSEDESWRVRKDRSRFWVHETMTALCENGKVVGFLKISRDLTERKRAEDALRESEERQRLMIEDIKEYAIFMLDPEGLITTWNSGVERILGYKEDEILGKPGAIIFTPEDCAVGAPEKERRTALEKGQAIDERWHVRKDKSTFWGSGVLTALRDAAGNLRGFSKVMRDNTERRLWEEQLRKAHDELELRVEERTAELARANQDLQREVSERTEAEIARKELVRQLVTAQEEERRHLSHELHDQMGQHVTALLLGIAALKDSPHVLPSASPILDQLRSIAVDLGREAHHLAWELRPPSLDDLGLATTLQNYTEEWSLRYKIRVDFHAAGLSGRLPASLEITIYRLVQEALTNAVRHGEANNISVILEKVDHEVSTIVEDNGCGFDPNSVMETRDTEGHLGLLGMRERLAHVGGTLQVESSPGSGTTLFFRIPLRESGEALPNE